MSSGMLAGEVRYPSSAPRISAAVKSGSKSSAIDHADGRRQRSRMRHGEVDRAGADLLGPGPDAAGQGDGGLRAARDLDVLPGPEARDPESECLADRLLAGEARGVVLGGVRARVAVRPLGRGEAALAEARPLERAAHALDLDEVDPDGRHGAGA